MNLRSLILISLSPLFFGCAHSQTNNYYEQFAAAHQKGDTSATSRILEEWAPKGENDPQLYVAYFNYYINKASTDVIALQRKAGEGTNFIVKDSNQKVVGYMGGTTMYDAELSKKGFEYIDKGIAKWPDRLDMRFGKIFMLGKVGDFENYTKSVVAAIEHGNKIKHKWLWLEGKPREDPKNFFYDKVQGYIGTIYDTEDDSLLPYMVQISEAVLKYEPNDVRSLSNIATAYLVTGKNEQGLPYLLKAEQITPKDVIVLNNIAECYKRLKQQDNAKRYYEKMIEYGNDEDKAYAKEAMGKL